MAPYPDTGVVGRRMAQHVGEPFLHDAETGMVYHRRYGVARAAHFQVDIQPGSSDAVDEVTQVGQLRWAEGSVSTVIVPKHLEGGTQFGKCVRRGRGDVVEYRDLTCRRLLVSEVGGS